MPITEWTYKTETNALHMGPMAQDFYQQFRLGADQKAISTVDEGGVALAAIKGLNQKLEMQLKEKDAQIGELHKQLQELEQAVNSLKEKK